MNEVKELRRSLANAKKRLLYYSGRAAFSIGAKRYNPKLKNPMEMQVKHHVAQEDVLNLELELQEALKRVQRER